MPSLPAHDRKRHVPFTNVTEPVRRAPGRPRDDSREQAILASALTLLTEVGYEALTVEAVARRAQASKKTIYRRWSGKRELVVAAVTSIQGDPLEDVDTGTLRGDLLALCHRLADTLRGSQGPLVLALLQSTTEDPDLCDLFETGAGHTGARLPDEVLARAVARGELPESARAYGYDEVAGATMILRALTGYRLDAAYLEHLVDAVLLPVLRHPAGHPPGPALFAGGEASASPGAT